MSSLTYEAACTTLTRRLSHHSRPTLDSYRLPATAQVTWPNAKKRKSSTGTLRINLAPVILDTTGRPG